MRTRVEESELASKLARLTCFALFCFVTRQEFTKKGGGSHVDAILGFVSTRKLGRIPHVLYPLVRTM